MNRLHSYSFILLLAAALCAPAATVYAQALPVRQAAKAGLEQSVRQSGATAGKALSLTLVKENERAAAKAMSENQKRLMFRLMTTFGMSRRNALNYLYERGAAPHKIQTAKLADKTFQIQRLNAYAVASTTEAPAYPFESNRITRYRGMTLSQADIDNILTNGLRIEDLGAHNSDFLIVNTLPSRALMEMSRSRCGDGNICFTHDPEQAARYSTRYLDANKTVPVIVHVKNTLPAQPNPMGAGVLVSQSVPASHILRISALLQIDGEPVWGLLQPARQGGYTFRPYLP